MSRRKLAVAPTFRTQKARGLETLNDCCVFTAHGVSYVTPHTCGAHVFPHEDQRPEFPFFARPCPTTPRHGFVESRTVHNHDELLRVIAETLREDPKGEVIMMRRLSGAWSGIATHAGVTFGAGNDGATAGRNAKFVPAWCPPEEWQERAIQPAAVKRAHLRETGYVEFVENAGAVALVQLRDGPAVPKARNFVPHEVQVREVLTPNNGEDLLMWEAIIKGAATRPGVVVYHPGGALSSHYAVHAITHGIPVVVDGPAPRPGETLAPSGDTPDELRARDYQRIAVRLRARLETGAPIEAHGLDARSRALTAIGTLHAMPQWGREKHLIALRAEGLAHTLLFTAAACIGEVRHWKTEGPGRGSLYCTDHYRDQPTCDAIRRLWAEHVSSEVDRVLVYEDAFRAPWHDVARWTAQAADDLEGKWARGYGGPKWAAAARECAQAFSVVETFLASPSAETWRACADAYNRVVNAVHNGGGILTKWIPQSAMDNAAEVPGPCFVNPFAARVVLGLETPVAAILEDRALDEQEMKEAA